MAEGSCFFLTGLRGAQPKKCRYGVAAAQRLI
jgi:hypothetical protein